MPVSSWDLFGLRFIRYFINLSGKVWFIFWIRLGDIPLAILFTWLYNRTKGESLLPVLFLHASMNATSDYLPRVKLTVYALLGIVVLIIIFTDRMWLFKPIKEIYDACYPFFQKVREFIGEIPAELIRSNRSTKEIVRGSTQTLNDGLPRLGFGMEA